MTKQFEPNKMLTQLVLFCRKAFEAEPGGRTLAAKVGLHEDRLLERYRIGYASEAIMRAVPAKGGVRDAMTEMGLLTKEGKLAIAGNIVIPVMDRDGNAAGFVAVDPEGRERRFPASAPLYRLNPFIPRNRLTICTESAAKGLRYVQEGIMNVLVLGGNPGREDEAFLKQHRPQKAYVEAEGPGLADFLQGMETPCYRLLVPWPASRAEINAAIKKAEPMEISMGENAAVRVLDDAVRFKCGERDYELCDIDPRETERLKVRLRALKNGSFHLDTLDLYAARSRTNFAKAATALYNVPQEAVEADLCLMIRKIEAIRAADQRRKREQDASYVMTADEEAEAIDYLRKPQLLDRIIEDMGRLGYIGESLNKKLGYLITISRKLESPLCGVILSRAGAGKSSLMDALAEMVPAEDLAQFTRITPQALYYADPKGLRNKVLMSGEDEGLSGADYALRELISSKKIKLALPMRDSESGKFRIEEYEVEGPIALLLSTTKPAMHFENATRCFTLSLDESPEQTLAILQAQRVRRTIARVENGAARDDVRRLQRNVQRLLRPLLVVNPYAPYLEFPTQPLEMRREHEKYLSLIEAITLLHQHQRERKIAKSNGREIEYVEVAVEDIEEANRIMTEILGAAREELSRPSKELLHLIKEMVDKRSEDLEIDPKALRFNRRDIREHTGWSDSQIKSHIGQLEELEYLLVSKGERGRMYRYELAFEAEKKVLSGLTDTAKLRALARRGMVRKSGMVCHGLAADKDQESLKNSNGKPPESLKVWQNRERGIGRGKKGGKKHE